MPELYDTPQQNSSREDPWRLRTEKTEGLKFPQASDENIGNLSVANGR